MRYAFGIACWGVVVLCVTLLTSGCNHPDADEGCFGDCVCYGAECDCPDSGDCEVHCGDDCDLTCSGSGDCDFVCDVACQVSNPGSGETWADVLAGSSISCTGSGDCYITCHGDCTVDCPGSAVCTVHCLDGGVCTFDRCDDEPVDCDGVTSVCNGGCP